MAYDDVERIYIPPDKNDTAWPLFNEPIVCTVLDYQLSTMDYVKIMGRPDSGDDESNQGAAKTKITVAIPVSKMMEYYERGIPVGVPNRKDCLRIYEMVNRHLHAWANIVKDSFNPGRVPVKDLIALDKFAASVHPLASEFFEQEANRKTFGALLFGKPSLVQRAPVVTKAVKTIGHRSLTQFFKNNGEVSERVTAEVPRKKSLSQRSSAGQFGLGD